MTHPFNKEKKAADTAHAEAAKEHHTHERQEKNALHTERGQEARQVNFPLLFCHCNAEMSLLMKRSLSN
jgi:hypothetical protein